MGDAKIEAVLEVVEVEKCETDKGTAWRNTLAPDRPGRPGVQCGIIMDTPLPAGAKYHVEIQRLYE
jgi:hypothetical protein